MMQLSHEEQPAAVAGRVSQEVVRARAISGSLARRKELLEAAINQQQPTTNHIDIMPTQAPATSTTTPSLNDHHHHKLVPPVQEKRSRAIRITSSIRKAGHSLSPRITTSTTTLTATTTTTTTNTNNNQRERTQRASRLFSPKSSNNNNTTTQTNNNNNNIILSPTSPAAACSVPITPVSPDCNSNTIQAHNTISNQSTSTNNNNKSITTLPSMNEPIRPSPSVSPEPPQALSQHPLPLSSNYHPQNSPPQITPSSSPNIPPLIQDTTIQTPSPQSDLNHHRHQSLTSTTPTASKHNPSQNVLSIALSKAQTAVQLDTALQIPEAIRAYTEAVLLLEEVIENIDATNRDREQKEAEALSRDEARDKICTEAIWKQLARDNLNDLDREELESRLREREQKWQEKLWKVQKRKKARAEEGERLIGIHNTYASRIAELQVEVLSNPRPTCQTDHPPESPSTPHWSQHENQESSFNHYRTLPEGERTSVSSDSTTREAVQSHHYDLPSTPQPTNQEQLSLLPESLSLSYEIEEEEEKDIVSERLPRYDSIHSQNNRSRTSSSASLSLRGTTQSSESLSSSIFSHPYNLNQPRSTHSQASSVVQVDLSDAQNQSSLDPRRPASRQPNNFPDAATLDFNPSPNPRSVVPQLNQTIPRQPSRKLLVSQTTTQGTISQRRRSPSCLDTARQTLSRSHGHQETGATLSNQPINPTDLSSSMHRRPSNLCLMGTVPSAAIPIRLRSYSQPGKRPGLPPSFLIDNSHPVPSSPLRSVVSQGSTSPKPCSIPPNSANAASQDIPPSSPLNLTPTTLPLTYPNGGMTRSDSQHALPAYEIQPYAHAFLSPGSMYAGSAAPVGELPAYPTTPARRPFHLMRQIRASMSTGAYVSPRLYVPRQMWYQIQIKLHGLETKIKLMDTLIAGLELVERDGAVLIGTDIPGGPPTTKESLWDFSEGRKPKPTLSSQVLTVTERFMKRLEVFEELLDSLQTGGAKKLGLNASGAQETAYGQDTMRKGGGFGTLMAHKLGKGLDRINIGRGNADLPSLYIDTIARLFDKSQAIDAHLASLDLAVRTQGNTVGAGMYGTIGQQSKQHIEGRLRRVSEFYSTVVCRFVVADMGVLLDKYVKRGGSWCSD